MTKKQDKMMICPNILTGECTIALANYLGCKMYYLHEETEDCHSGGKICKPCVDISLYEICPEYYRCHLSQVCPLAQWHRKHEGSIVHKEFQKEGVCPACIPYESESTTLQTCELPKGEKCPYTDCKGCDCPLGMYNSFNPKVVEPQPTTCPDCGHPEHKGRCSFSLDGKNIACDCGQPPADQPEKHCTKPLKVDCFHVSTSGSCLSEGKNHGRDCEWWGTGQPEQPTQMPLREQFGVILDKFARSYKNDVHGENSYRIYQTLKTTALNALESEQQARDQQVAKQAVMEFALNLVHEIAAGHFDNDSGDLLEPELINYIKAIAEGKE